MKMFEKLNRKGFTLIELLAVIVILAIVMGISATSVLRSINQSRKSSLLSTAQNAANQLNTWAGEDALIVETSSAHLGSTFINNVGTDTWKCLSGLSINNGGTSITLTKALGLSTSATDTAAGDIKVNGSVPRATATSSRNNCSAIRYNSKLGAFEIFLSAGKQGKYYVAADGESKNFAFSRGDGYAVELPDR